MCEIADHPPDGRARAAEVLRCTADGGDDQARVAFAYLLNRGIGLERNAELAADYLLVAAENGNAEAQLQLGVMYCLGEGVPQDFDQATAWLWEAEHAGLLEAAVWRNYVRVVTRKGHVRRLVELNADDVLVRNPKRLLEEAVEDLPDYSSEPWVEKENSDALRRHAAAAAAGNTDSQWKLALMLANGKGIPEDTSAARKWYRRAADGGSRTAQFMLGDFYENNAEMIGQRSTEERAAFWYRKADEQGHRPARARLGVLAWRLGLASENEGRLGDAVRWYTVSADVGNGLGLWKLGAAYAVGKGVERDVDKAKDLLTAASAAGLVEAEFELARLNLKGGFEEADPAARREWLGFLTTASASGFAEAQYELAQLHLNGSFEGSDPAAGREMLIHAAENGSAEATTVLRLVAGAEEGDGHIQFILGNIYSEGPGVVQQDHAEAFRWWLKAAEQGDAAAQFSVGFVYAEGQVVAQDYAEAGRWWLRAAEQGDAAAQFSLGRQYIKGLGVRQDYSEAAGWLRKAARQGHKAAHDSLEALGLTGA
jgi:TPR repeat protein